MKFISAKITKYALLVVLSLAILSSCKKEPVEIVILSTNDIHAKIDNFDKVAAYVAKQREQHPNVLLLNGGDMFSGNPVVDQYKDKGFPIIEIMNKIGYNYTAIGNHEFDYDREIMAMRMKQAAFPWICANIHVSAEGIIPQPKPYIITTIDGVKIAILGLVEVREDSKVPSTHPDKVTGITFTDPIEEALKYKSLKDSCNLFIGLTHIGTTEDVKLAEKMPELDIIVGGHSHTQIDTGMLVNGVLITQTRSWLDYIGKTTVVIEDGKVVSKKNELIDVSKLTDVDVEISKLIKDYYDKSGLNEVIAENISTIDTKEAFGCLMTDAITDLPNIQIAFQNSGGVRSSKLEKGDINVAAVYTLDPFGNEIIYYEMTPAEMRELIFQNGKFSKPDLFVSGITYVLPKSGNAKDVIIKTADGKKLDENKRYPVGMNSFIASAYEFTGSEKGKSLHKTSADALIDYLRKVKKIDYAGKTRTAVAE